jgi:hypothetical protein
MTLAGSEPRMLNFENRMEYPHLSYLGYKDRLPAPSHPHTFDVGQVTFFARPKTKKNIRIIYRSISEN